jgi:hypothetical protein
MRNALVTVLMMMGGVGAGFAAKGLAVPVYELNGARVAARFVAEHNSLRMVWVKDVATGEQLAPGEIFSLKMRDGRVIPASAMKLKAMPAVESVEPVSASPRAAEHVRGQRMCADLATADSALTVHWCATLREGANYLRQEVTLKAGAEPVDVAEVRMFDFAAPSAQVVGKVPGSPIVAGNFFFGFEFPLSANTVRDGRATALLARILPLEPGNAVTYSSVVGVAAPGQMRREFLAYIEQERAHPYRTFLHYNSWYDLGYFSRFDEAGALDRVNAFGAELVKKRGVKLDSFLFDDGWDDPQTLWQFNAGMPNGFTKIHEAASGNGFGIGVWMSPWGGYGTPKKQRIAAGEKAGYETVQGGFALSAPKYYGLFEKTCLDMVTRYGVNQFKFDGTGNASTVFPGSLFDSDFSAAIHLIERLRQQDPGIFINLTTGTLPSPFWLRYADSIWRDGDDHSFDGVGSWRQKWITYRDEQTYRNIVLGGPLYPLNSLMLHGLIYAQHAKNLGTDPDGDFTSEVRDYFGTGTQLQEMYITPSLLTAKDWDALAEAAKWSRANAAVLKDTHWIGGDPGKLEVYGWASWSPEKGIVTLRNPSDKAQTFALDVEKAFELPKGAAQNYKLSSPWAADEAKGSVQLVAGKPWKIELEPFQVLTFDAQPIK